jgi:hypothetical protein
MHGDTASVPAARAADAPTGNRLPPPGQVVTLDEDAAPKTDDGDGDGDAPDEQPGEGEEPDELPAEADGDQDGVQPWSRVAEFHPRQVRGYVLEHHGDASKRFKLLVYNAGAAGTGWGFGWEGRLHSVLVACGRETGDPYAAMILGAAVVGAAVALIDRRTRHWWWPLAWVCRIPLATAILALALYTPAATIR